MAGWQEGAVEGERPVTSGGEPTLEPCVSQGMRGQAVPGLASPRGGRRGRGDRELGDP